MQRKHGKKSSKRKLQLKKETVRTLSATELSAAAGGALNYNNDSLECTILATGGCPGPILDTDGCFNDDTIYCF